MDRPAFTIRYRFALGPGSEREFVLRLDPVTLAEISTGAGHAPDWARLENEKCPNCPLQADRSPNCPAAEKVASLVASFQATRSFDEAEIWVELPERTIVKRTSVQKGLGSLMGIYLAASGCPILAKLRPMVRFHLPFATEDETVFRAVSMYLVGQYLRAQNGTRPDWELKGLTDIYRQVSVVNRAFAARLRGAVDKDANLNAVVVLDTFAKAMPNVVEDHLAEFEHLFDVWR